MPAITSDFVPSTHQGSVIITRGDGKFKIEMSPAETEKATHIVGFALSMISMEFVPEHITHTPFVIRFFPNQVMALERVDQKDTLPFRAKEGDDFIQAIRMAHGMCLNEQTQGKAAMPRGPVTQDLIADYE